jgi:hypothetical protein
VIEPVGATAKKRGRLPGVLSRYWSGRIVLKLEPGPPDPFVHIVAIKLDFRARRCH